VDDLKGMTAAVLAGGLGTRLREAVSDRPKVLAEVGGRPFLSYLLQQLHGAGVRRTVLCVGWRGDEIEHCFGDRFGDMQLDYSSEPVPLGTGGALRRALPRFAGGRVLALNGDSIVDFDVRRFAAGTVPAMVVTERPDTRAFGRVELDGEQVVGFAEKSAAEGPGWINAGVYLAETSALEALTPDRPLSLEREVLPAWVGRLRAFRAPGAFFEIGTPAAYAQAVAGLPSLFP
jgi:D-glycero-alpha-D-manno-heptose 1-phosphate guanylyltransferase